MKNNDLLLFVFAAMFFIGMCTNSFADDIVLTTTSPTGGGWTFATNGNDIYAPNSIAPQNGVVGIGTATPGLSGGMTPTKLDVFGSGWTVIRGVLTGQTINSIHPVIQAQANKTSALGDGFGSAIEFSIGDTSLSESVIGLIGAVRDGSNTSGKLEFASTNNGTYTYGMAMDKAGNVGIGTMTPGFNLHISPLSVGSSASSLCLDGYGIYNTGTGELDAGLIYLRHAHGTKAAPTATQMNDLLGVISFSGYDGTGYNNAATVGCTASENWTSSAHGTLLSFGSTDNGRSSPSFPLQIKGNTVQFGSPSGGGPILVYGNTTVTGPFTFVPIVTPSGVSNGSIYVDTSNNFKIYLNGAWRTIISGSSLRYKENIAPIKDDFSKILQAEPKSFTYKKTKEKDIGYIAEDFDKLGLKNLVEYDKEGKPSGIKYDKVSIYLLEVVKGQEKKIAELNKRIETLEKQKGL